MIELDKVRKEYPGVRAVDGVSFVIHGGTCFGLLGPNGAGKTTTVEMLEGIRRPSAGDIRYRGLTLGRRFREEAGIMFQHTALPDYLTVRQVLRLFRQLYTRPLPLEELIERCALGEFLNRDTRHLSGGQRQRLHLALALVNDPQVLFLDEPTTGLDPQSRRNLWRQLREIKAANRTLVLTTHYMEEAYELCDEIAIMDRGRIVAQGIPSELLRRHYDNTAIILPLDALPPGYSPGPDATLHPLEDRVEILTRDVNRCIRQLLEQSISLDRLQVRTPNLEDLFLELTGHQLRS